VRDEEPEQRIKNVAAGNNCVLVGEIKGERENSTQIEREGREAEKDVDSGGRDDSGYPTEDEITDVKMSGKPEDKIPERRMALVAEAVQEKLGQAEIAGKKPCLCFIIPRLMPGNGARERDEIDHPYNEVAEFPTQHVNEFSRAAGLARLVWGIRVSLIRCEAVAPSQCEEAIRILAEACLWSGFLR
jgi:hypothetical protein